MKKVIKWGLIGLVALIVIGAISNKDGSSTTQPISNTPTPTTTPSEIIKVEAKSLISDFDKNKLSAEDQWKNKTVEFSAKVKNISTDIMGSPYLSLEPATNEQYYFGTTIQCFFKSEDELKTLENGKIEKLRGTVDGMTIGIITIKNCSIVK